MFRPVKRASKSDKFWMARRAEEVAKENGTTFTGEIDSNPGSAYTAEFVTDGDYFYGWAIKNSDPEDERFDFIFGSGQIVDFEPDYVITEDDYYGVIGAGV